MRSSLLRGVVLVVSGLISVGLIAGCRGMESIPSPTLVPVAAVVKIEPTRTSVPTEARATPTAKVSPTERPTVTPLPSATATWTPTATVVPTAVPTHMPVSTLMPTPTEALSATPTSTPIELIRFMDSEDCQDGISQELLPLMDLTVATENAAHRVVVEVADDARERQQGLMCREVVPFGTGMFFVFEQPRPLNFWMFNTHEALDIVYLGEDKSVIKALRMEPCPRPDGYEYGEWRSYCSSVASGYGSMDDALYALELPAGWLAQIGIELESLEGVELSW